MNSQLALFLILSLWITSSCTPKSSTSQSTDNFNRTDLVERGRKVYGTNCTACHHINPKLDGSLGPAVFGVSKELLVARIIDGGYPNGYTPKRSSKIMVALPHLKNDIDALTAYLNP